MEIDLRKRENTHIVLWLVKDFAWLMGFEIIGIAMAVPTILLALWIALKSRKNKSDFFHNIAVVCWIAGNIIWMAGEFFCDDCSRPFAMPFFILGFGVLLYFYVNLWIKNGVFHGRK